MEFLVKEKEIQEEENYDKISRQTRTKQLKINNYFKQKKRKKPINPITKSINPEVSALVKQEGSKIIQNKEKKIPASIPNKNREQASDRLPSENKRVNYQFIFQNLSKMIRKDGIFLEARDNYAQVYAFKDYNVSVIIENKKLSLGIRFNLGNYADYRVKCQEHGNNISELKRDFDKWFNNQKNKASPSQEVQEKIDSFLLKHPDTDILYRYKDKLVQKIVTNLRKTNKQPKGYETKLDDVYQSWLSEASEVIHIEDIENELNFNSYEQSFPLARKIQRKFTILIGPTNSGKTHEALNILSNCGTGAYLAPLRLMAQEGQESLFERAVLADLITGEEQKKLPNSTHTSSTIEMCNMSKMIDCAVIDEIQMISDDSRGWAWSQALIGVPAKHVVLVGSEEALPFIIPVIENFGEPYEIRRFERKTPLRFRETVWRHQDLKSGDCIVVFSRKSALEMKNQIESVGKRCSVIYGNLSPEVRRLEAQKFKNEQNPILIATDAIGMGLNLPIKRLFFSTLQKFDGTENRYLNVSEIKQIAGRAGRYGFNDFGEVGLLVNDKQSDKDILQSAIEGGYEKKFDLRIPIAPNLSQIKTICETIGKNDLYSALIFFKEKLIRDHKLYKTANLESMIEIAALIKNKNFDLATGLNYACVPMDVSSEVHMKHFFRFLNTHMQGKEVHAPRLPEVVEENRNDSYSLYEAENYVKLCMAYRWLHYKYPQHYTEIDVIVKNAQTTNQYIEKTLHRYITISKNPRWRK
jgi:ATP-dependent RNA helicase SUPV3L1/SUV3